MWQGERKPIPGSILSTFLHWVLFFTKYLFWECLEIKFCQASTFLSCMSGPLSISQSTKNLCLFNKRQAEPKNRSAVPENLDFIPSIHCLSSFSLSDIYLESKQLHKEVMFFLPSPKQLRALENAISEVCPASSVKWPPSPTDLPSTLLHTNHCKVVKSRAVSHRQAVQVQRRFSIWKTNCEKGLKREGFRQMFFSQVYKDFSYPSFHFLKFCIYRSSIRIL